MKLKIKWISICLLLCLLSSILAGFIPHYELRQSCCLLLGGICGNFCMIKYLDEKPY